VSLKIKACYDMKLLALHRGAGFII